MPTFNFHVANSFRQFFYIHFSILIVFCNPIDMGKYGEKQTMTNGIKEVKRD